MRNEEGISNLRPAQLWSREDCFSAKDDGLLYKAREVGILKMNIEGPSSMWHDVHGMDYAALLHTSCQEVQSAYSRNALHSVGSSVVSLISSQTS